MRNADGVTMWRTSSLPNLSATALPADYESPLLTWFRTFNLELTKSDDRMTIHAYVDMQRKAAESKFTLPTFDLFGTKKSETNKNDVLKPQLEPLPLPAKNTDGPKRF